MRKRMIYFATLLVLFVPALYWARQPQLTYSVTAAAGPRIPPPTPTPRGTPRKLPGSIGGVLFISNLKSDVPLECKSLEVDAIEIGGAQQLLKKATADGIINKKVCRYNLGYLPASIPFQLTVLKPKELKDCSQENFEADGTLPITLKSGEKLRRDITIRNITCTVVK